MHYDFPDVHLRREHGIGLLRETLSCRECGASMRDRQIARGLLREIGHRLGKPEESLATLRGSSTGSLRILDTDSFSAINRILRGMVGYRHSQFRPDRRNGEVLDDGSINVNLLEIPSSVGPFDIIITSDVMEHVVDDARAHREIYRCLGPGGTYLFTVPYDPCLLGTRKLTQSSGEPELRFLLDKQIHGDPHSGSGIFAHRIYGQQLFDDLAQIGFEVTFESIEDPAHGIFGGDLFTAVKRS